MENYISTVLNKIKDGKVKAEIQAELEDHYNERVEYYTRIGYDKETSEEKANAHFGEDAVIVGEQIALLGKDSRLKYGMFAIVSTLLIAFGFFNILNNFEFPTSAIGEFISVLLILLCLIELLVALKNKSVFLSGINIASCALFGVLFWNRGFAYYFVYLLISGKADEYVEIINVIIFVLRAVFWITCIALSVFTTALCVKSKKCEYKKHNIRQEKIVRIALFLLLCIILFMIICMIAVAIKQLIVCF